MIDGDTLFAQEVFDITVAEGIAEDHRTAHRMISASK
jgi:hypothetical protein